MAQVSRVYRDPDYADELAGKAPERARIHQRRGFAPGATLRHPDPRGVLRAINDYELMKAFGGWWQMTGEHPDVVVLARMQLVMAGIADAERRMQADMEHQQSGGGGSTGGSGGRGRWSGGGPASSTTDDPPPGGRAERQQTVSVARSQWNKKKLVYARPDPLAG